MGDRAAQRRLGALQLAERLGNVSEACRRLRIDRGSFYAWRRRFDAGGIEALRPRSHHGRQAPTKAQRAAGIIRRLALEHPGWGCARMAEALVPEGIHLSPPTVQSALRYLGLARREDRALRLEQLAREGRVQLDAEQIAVVERFEPGFRDRSSGAVEPGAHLLQAAFYFGVVEGRRLHVHCVLDAYSSFAFARLADGRERARVAAALLGEAVRVFHARGLVPATVFTPDAPAYSDHADHPYGLVRRRWRLNQARSQAHGQVERFRRRLLDDLRHADRHLPVADGVSALATRFEICLARYNSRSLAGHPNYGVAPLVRLGSARPAERQHAG